MRTVPAARSTSTSAPGEIACTAAVTAFTQWPQVMSCTLSSIIVPRRSFTAKS
jgi:hypothetical protein